MRSVYHKSIAEKYNRWSLLGGALLRLYHNHFGQLLKLSKQKLIRTCAEACEYGLAWKFRDYLNDLRSAWYDEYGLLLLVFFIFMFFYFNIANGVTVDVCYRRNPSLVDGGTKCRHCLDLKWTETIHWIFIIHFIFLWINWLLLFPTFLLL